MPPTNTTVALYGALRLAEDLALELVGKCNNKEFHQAQVDSIRADLALLEQGQDDHGTE